MKVTIDTKEDSYEDIQKIVHLLTNIMEKKGYNQVFESKESIDTTAPMTMFSDAPAAEKAPDFNSFLGLIQKKEEKKEPTPRVEIF